MAQVGNWASETCNTEGTAPLYLTGARPQRIRFRQFATEGDVWYVVEDIQEGTFEVGIGHFDGRDLITRDNVLCIASSDGIYDRNPASPLELSGNSVVSSMFTAEAYEEIQQNISSLITGLLDRPIWRGVWIPQQYVRNDMVSDDTWLMIANKTTQDKPAPEFAEERVTYIPEDISNVVEGSNSETFTGYLVTFAESGALLSVYANFPPMVSSAQVFLRIYSGDIESGALIAELEVLLDSFDNWYRIETPLQQVSANTLYTIGIAVIVPDSPTSAEFSSVCDDLNSSFPPPSYSWNKNAQNSILRIHRESIDNIDYQYLIGSLGTGDSVRIEDANNPGNYFEFSVVLVTSVGDAVELDVNLLSQGGGGTTLGEISEITLNFDAPPNTQYKTGTQAVNLPDGILTLDGVLEIDGVLQSGQEDAVYGAGVEFQGFELSPDWDIMAYGNTISSGDNGGSGSFSAEVTEHFAQEGQRLFTTPVYVVGTGSLAVYINGVRQYPSTYAETSTISVTFSEGLRENDQVMCEVRK